jgi:hypothetical protein
MMQLMRLSTAAAAITICVGCATTSRDTGANFPDDRPVGTTGSTVDPNEPAQVQGDRMGQVPVGQEIDVRLQTALSSATATAEQRFTATTAVDLMQGDRVLIPAGSVVRGVVSSVDKAGNIDRSGRLTLAFDQITVRGRDHEFRGMATEVFESRGIRDEVGTVGAAGAVGAIVGGIIGGVKGAIIGAGVGSGGVIAATEGKDIELPAGTVVRVRLDTPLRIR